MAYISKYVEVEVEVDTDDLIKDLTAKEKTALVAELLEGSVPFGLGDGDASRANHIIERAYAAARSLSNLPREIADLFWVVHGRAI